MDTVEVVTAPVSLNPADVTVNCEDPITPLALGSATATDNCDATPVITYADATNNTNPCSVVITRTWTATDNCGNASTCNQVITVVDVTAPVITCPADVTVNCEDPITPAALGTATALDNCDATPEITYTDAINNTYTYTATTEISTTATDDSAPACTCNQVITVVDVTA